LDIKASTYFNHVGAEVWLHYEFHDDIVADPEAVIERICGIMGLDAAPAAP